MLGHGTFRFAGKPDGRQCAEAARPNAAPRSECHEGLRRGAVRLARQARERVAGQPVAIAGSICEWIHADQPRWHDPAALGASVAEQAEILAAAGVDLIALEMCQQSEYTLAAIEAAARAGLPLWIGISARRFEGRAQLSVFDYPEREFAELVETVAATPAMILNVMHSPIDDIDAALDVVARYWSGPVGVYPESGYFAMPDWQFVDIIEADDLVGRARDCIARGVRLVGGCCGIGPGHIAALKRDLASRGSASDLPR